MTKVLRAYPETADAVLDPACYSKEGMTVTTINANAVLGCLSEPRIGGSLNLYLDAARKAFKKVANDLGYEFYEAAKVVLKVSNGTIYSAHQLVSVEQGYDPRDFSLVAFYGAGPLHANGLGKLIGSFHVIVPPSPGVLCAFGHATISLRHEIGIRFIDVIEKIDHQEILQEFERVLHKVKSVIGRRRRTKVHTDTRCSS